MCIDNATHGQVLECKLCACIHIEEQLNTALKDDNHFISDLILRVFVHIEKQAAFLLDFGIAKIGEIDEDLLGCVLEVVDSAERVCQEELRVIVVELYNVSLDLRFEIGIVADDLGEKHVVDDAESGVKFSFNSCCPSAFVQERYLTKVVSAH